MPKIENEEQAIALAAELHKGQVDKGGKPYIEHPKRIMKDAAARGLPMDYRILAALHDVIEDCGEAHREIVRMTWGDTVAAIVEACTDGTAERKADQQTPEAKLHDWRQRKLKYLEHLKSSDDATLLVSACDKLHNARAIVIDLERPEPGSTVFDRFTAGKDGTLRYYHSLSLLFAQRDVKPARELEATVATMHQGAPRHPLDEA